MSEKEFRNKVCWFTFAYSVLVVWVHSYNSELFLGKTLEAQSIARIERVFGNAIAQFAVPGFFMISAYLFYRNFGWEKLERKWMSRVRSILIPFITWNFLYYLGYVAASRIPFLGDVVGKGQIPFGLIPTVDAILHYTYNYVFWYLYQLILLIVLAPVLYPVLKRKLLGVAFMLLLALAAGSGMTIPRLNLDALLYYSGGAWMALHARGVIEGRWNWKKGASGLGVLAASLVLGALDLRDGSRRLEWTVMSRLLVPFSLWLLVPEQKLCQAKSWMQYNFFLYATHFALVRLINKTAAQMPWRHAALPLVLYLLMPVFTVAFSYGAGMFLRRYLPFLWLLLNGGRSGPEAGDSLSSDRTPAS